LNHCIAQNRTTLCQQIPQCFGFGWEVLLALEECFSASCGISERLKKYFLEAKHFFFQYSISKNNHQSPRKLDFVKHLKIKLNIQGFKTHFGWKFNIEEEQLFALIG